MFQRMFLLIGTPRQKALHLARYTYSSATVGSISFRFVTYNRKYEELRCDQFSERSEQRSPSFKLLVTRNFRLSGLISPLDQRATQAAQRANGSTVRGLELGIDGAHRAKT